MSRRQLRSDLADVRGLIAIGRTELDRAAGGMEDYWIESARRRLAELDRLLIMASSKFGSWTRAAISAVITFAGVLGVATVAQAAGLPGGWVIAAAVLTMIGLSPVAYRLNDRLEHTLEHRRVRQQRPDAVVPGFGPLTAVPERLLLARTRLVSATLRQVGTADWRPPILLRRVTSDPALICLQDADLLLCQALDQLATHVEEHGR